MITIKEFLRKQNYKPKLRIKEGDLYTLVYGGAIESVVTDNNDNQITALKIIVRDKADNEVKSWVTRSLSTLDKISTIEVGDTFTLKRLNKSFAGKVMKIYEVEIIKKADDATRNDMENATDLHGDDEIDISDIEI